MSTPLLVVYSLWVMKIMEPEWLLFQQLGAPLYWLPTLLAPIALLFALQLSSPKQIYWPLIIFTCLHIIASVFAGNAGYARGPTKFLLHTIIIFMATFAYVRTPQQFLTLAKILLVGFVWYGVQGLPNGKVGWHPLLGNEDSFGPLMGLGIGFGYYFARSSRSRLWQAIGLAAACLGVVGVIASFARGAVLAACGTGLVIWVRSPNKMRTLFAGVTAILIAVGAASIIFPSGEFWAEMSTIKDSGESGTGQGRLILWGLAFRAYTSNPILGVGSGNCGTWISENVEFDGDRSQFSDPSQIYSGAMHNDFVTVFCEEGTVGAIAFLVMIVGFARRIRFARSELAARAWFRNANNSFDIRELSLGLEVAMVAYLTNAIFYNQLYIHWFWTLVTLAYVLDSILRTCIRTHRSNATRANRLMPEETKAT